jgi:hypothetical protein
MNAGPDWIIGAHQLPYKQWRIGRARQAERIFGSVNF